MKREKLQVGDIIRLNESAIDYINKYTGLIVDSNTEYRVTLINKDGTIRVDLINGTLGCFKQEQIEVN
jgi:hypothetical protein